MNLKLVADLVAAPGGNGRGLPGDADVAGVGGGDEQVDGGLSGGVAVGLGAALVGGVDGALVAVEDDDADAVGLPDAEVRDARRVLPVVALEGDDGAATIGSLSK